MAVIPISELPTDVDLSTATQLCYEGELNSIADALTSFQSVLVECDKLLVPHLYRELRTLIRARPSAPEMRIVDHRYDDGEGAIGATLKAFRGEIAKLAEYVREGQAETSVVVVPNFDLMVTGDQTGQHVDMMAREVMAVLYENPELRVLAFKDPNLAIPKPVLEFFSRRTEIFGIGRTHLPRLITQAEARRLNTQHFEPYRLFKFVSGLNVVKLRQLLSGLSAPHYTDGDPEPVLRELRQATIDVAEAELPHVPLEMIGGYDGVKKLLSDNILSFMRSIESSAASMSEKELSELENLIPRNILFTGPPGTGKTMFCKALATELNATVIVVNGPELKSKWVGESEERIRKIFSKARKCAPSLVVFDELDSFGGKRGGGSGSSGQAGDGRGVGHSSDHSMLNQLLTEMDGFRSSEAVFVIGTTNFASSLDDALRSRMRYEIEIPYPNRADRAAILEIYDKKFSLGLSAEVLSSVLDDTEAWIDQNTWTRFAGRDLEALGAALGRAKLIAAREQRKPLSEVAITEAMAARAVAERIRNPYHGISFSDIGGYADVKARLQDEILVLLEQSKNLSGPRRRKIEKMIPKGVIFEGPPGTGKTMFAKALAEELKATVSVVNGPELKSMWHGESERKVREIFAEARRNAPSVLVFDEIDSIAGDRSQSSSGVDRSMVNQLLTEMDGFRGDELIFVVATTNFADSLDQALRRPGRFEYVIHIGYPDADARRAILNLYNEKYGLGLDEEAISHLVFKTDNWVDIKHGIRYSGDHIEAICRGISRKKLREPDWQPTLEDLDQIVAQRTKKPVAVTDEEETVIATHEAGHAILALHVEGAAPIKKISIASEYDGSLGYVLHGEQLQKYVQDERQLRAQLVCLMGGRVAERLVFGRVASGGANDIQKATLIATHLVAAFGMDPETGPRMILHPLIHGEKAAGATSPELLAKVERRVGEILVESEREAEKLIVEHRKEFDELRAKLLEEKTIEFAEGGKLN